MRENKVQFKERSNANATVTIANLTLEDRGAKRRTIVVSIALHRSKKTLRTKSFSSDGSVI